MKRSSFIASTECTVSIPSLQQYRFHANAMVSVSVPDLASVQEAWRVTSSSQVANIEEERTCERACKKNRECECPIVQIAPACVCQSTGVTLLRKDSPALERAGRTGGVECDGP